MTNISNTLSEIDESIEKEAKLACGDIDTICDALCKYESMQKGAAQCYFDKMCKEATISPENQIMIKNAFEKKVDSVSGMPKISLDIHESLTQKSDYSLGDFSLQKTATESFTKSVITDSGEYIDGILGLTKIASSMQEELANIDELKSMRSVLETDVKNILDNQE